MTNAARALVVLLAVVAWGSGGYDSWALLLLEVGTGFLLLAVVGRALRRSETDTEMRLSQLRAWKRVPFWLRHPDAANLVRLLTLGGFPSRRSTPEVEILLPGSAGVPSVELDLSRKAFVLGHAVKRTGLLAPLALLTLWIAMSLVPLQRSLLGILSPEAALLRTEAEALLDSSLAVTAAPWSLAPFPSFRGLWLWLSVIALFHVAFRAARTPEGASRLIFYLFLLGAASGLLGIAGFFSDLHAAYGQANEALRAKGSFGNPNHYAAFQSMLLLVSLGWLASFRERSHRARGMSSRHRSPEDWNDRALAVIGGLGILLVALGLLLSLSRSGIVFALAGAGSFVLMIRNAGPGSTREGASRRALVVLAFAVAGVAVWIGIEPLVGRFAGLGDQWEVETTRIQVWRDCIPAIRDFWLTGSGLSTFRYIGARYRSFGGSIFYSWAHNDYLQLVIELGAPGLLLLGWIGLAVVRATRRVRSDLAPERSLLALHAGCASAVLAIGLHSLTDFSLHIPANFALLAILVGVVVGMEPREENARPPIARRGH